MDVPVRISPLGVMDKDTDVQLVSNGNYTDAHDIRHRDLSGNAGASVIPVRGNNLEITLPTITSQTKQYVVYVDINAAFSQDGIVVPPVGKLTLQDSDTALTYYTFDGSINPISLSDFVTKLQNELDNLHPTAATPFTYGTLQTTGAYTGYFTMEKNDLSVDDDFVIYYSGELIQNLVLVREYFEISLAEDASLHVIGSEEVDNDVFIVSATGLVHTGIPINELGVIQYNESLDTYSYTRLLRSTKLGLSREYRVQIRGERNQNKVSLYLTNRNNTPYCLYANKNTNGTYTQDVCLAFNGGDYSLETIADEAYLFLKNPDSILTVDEVSTGGQLKAGNKRYTGRFLTESLVGTEYLYPTGPVNIYLKSKDRPSEICGEAVGTFTDKQVTLTLSNIPPDVYKYFELVAIEYEGDTFTASMVQRYDITGVNELIVSHTNLGQEMTQISVNEILAVFSKYDKVNSLEILNNRLIVGGLTESIDPDLSSWAEEFTHSLEQTTIPCVGLMGDPDQDEPEYVYGEYQDPNNVLNFTSYMLLDTYRFGVQVKWKNTGNWSKAYWVDDIRFDLSADNVTGSISGSRRTANNIDTNFTDADNTETKVYYVKFDNIDLDAVSGSATIGSQITAIRFVRAKRIPEVLFTGMFIGGFLSSSKICVHDYPFQGAGYYEGLAAQKSDYLFFQSPDLELGTSQYTYQSGDTIKIIGSPSINDSQTVSAHGAVAKNYGDFTGYYDAQTPGSSVVDFTTISPSAYGYFPGHGMTKSVGGANVKNGAPANNGYTTVKHVFKVSSAIAGTIGTAAMQTDDLGIYYGVIFRDLGANLKYPVAKHLTEYGGCNHYRVILPGENGVIQEDVFGGDVFTQKTHMRLVIRDKKRANNFGSGMAYYSQNASNTQMRNILPHNNEAAGPGYLFPQYIDRLSTDSSTYLAGTFGAGLASYLSHWLDISNQREYNKGYDIGDPVITQLGYDEDSTFTGERKSSIAWSAIKTVGSNQDNYRIFKPIDYYDLDITKGELCHLMTINGALYTWQKNSFQRQYFNDATTIGSQGGSDVVIGAGSIFGIRGQELSSVGTDKKWSIIKGKNVNGKDVVWWYNDTLRKVARFGANGVNIISEPAPARRGNIASFLRTYANFLTDYHEPITGYGVHGVWNDRYAELIITVKAMSSEIGTYTMEQDYETGDLVKNTAATPTHRSGLPSIFRAKSNFNLNSTAKVPGTGVDSSTYWDELTPDDLPEYYTCFTIVYDEGRDGWECFHEYYPNIYIPIRDNFFSPSPGSEESIYVHDKGNYIHYYGTGYSGSITSVLNLEPDVTKQYSAISFGSQIAPFRVEFETKNHTSFLTESDFEEREDRFNSPIKNNAVAGVVTGDSSRLWGAYLKSTVFFEHSTAQKFFNYIIKVRNNPRLYSR
ncbi:MAG: hypothetical protein ACK5DE_10160 [Bacteroidota bacterium]|jgi:hypothetical protein